MKRSLLSLVVASSLAGGAIAAANLGPARASSKPAPNLNLYHNGWDSLYRNPFGAAPTSSMVTLRLRSASTVTKATVYVTDTNSGRTKQIAMTKAAAASSTLLWTGHVATPAKVDELQYWFKAQSGKTVRWVGDGTNSDNGPSQTVSNQANLTEYLINVYLSSFKTPSWMTNAVVYQIFPDRFNDGNKANDALEKTGTHYGYITTYFHSNWSDTPQDGPPYSRDFFGGDLQGVIDKLPYLQHLGITAIYLNPIFEAPSDHKYDTGNFLKIDPEFGTLQTFHTLVTRAKADGIHLILDGVFEDSGTDSVYFNQYGYYKGTGAYQSKSSTYYPWYTFYNWPDNYNDWMGVSTLALFKNTPAVQNFIFRKPGSVAQYWLNQGIGGWRLDSADTLPQSYWRAFRSVIKAKYPNSVIIGEKNGWTDALPWVLGDQWDGFMNYQFRNGVLDFFANGQDNADQSGPIDAAAFMDHQMGLLAEYPRPAILSSMNLVDSHDTARILTDLSFNKPALKLVAFYQMTWLGAPTVLYGDETGITGSDGNTSRATFPWSHQDTDLESTYKGLIAMRHMYPALTSGSVQPLLTNNSKRSIAYLRQTSGQQIVVALNDSNQTQTIQVPVAIANGTGLTGVNPGNSTVLSVKNGTLTITLAPLSGSAYMVLNG